MVDEGDARAGLTWRLSLGAAIFSCLALFACQSGAGGTPKPQLVGPEIAGIATGHLAGDGDFTFTLPNGEKCHGTYNGQLNLFGGSQVKATANCDNNHTYPMVVHRLPTGLPLYADVTMPNNTLTRVRFSPPPPGVKTAIPPPPPAAPTPIPVKKAK